MSGFALYLPVAVMTDTRLSPQARVLYAVLAGLPKPSQAASVSQLAEWTGLGRSTVVAARIELEAAEAIVTQRPTVRHKKRYVESARHRTMRDRGRFVSMPAVERAAVVSICPRHNGRALLAALFDRRQRELHALDARQPKLITAAQTARVLGIPQRVIERIRPELKEAGDRHYGTGHHTTVELRARAQGCSSNRTSSRETIVSIGTTKSPRTVSRFAAAPASVATSASHKVQEPVARQEDAAHQASVAA